MFEFGNANAEQKKAITTTEGPVLIIAGPGTGKTYTLVKRISYLVFEKEVPPSSIMVVTFTEKAAKELVTRISDEFLSTDENCRININEMYIGTFHSVCLRILKECSEEISGNQQSRVMDAFEQTYLVCRNLDNFRYLHGFKEHISQSTGEWKQAMEVCRYVNQIMEELVDIEKMEDDVDEDMRFLGRLVMRYKELLKKKNVMDFSSIQTDTWNLLEHNKEICQLIQNKIQYVMVDEYQDTNYIQEQLVFRIAGNRKNICVVGDDDQGMYRFRGATIRNILEYPDKFTAGECQIIQLVENFRSEPGIVDFYNKWMDSAGNINLFNWDKFRYPKQIVAKKSNLHQGTSVYTCGGDSIENEKYELLEMIQCLKSRGNISNLNQIAFLFKSVKSSEAMEIAAFLEQNGIPVYSPRSDMFFERKEIKQILGCIMYCFKQYMTDLKNNLFRYPISEELREYYIDCRSEAVALLKENEELKKYIANQALEIFNLKEDMKCGLLDFFYKILSFEPFKGYLQANINCNVIENRAARNLSEVSRMIAKYNFLHDMHRITPDNKNEVAEQWFNQYLKYLYIEGIGEYEDESEYAPSGCVSFMTIHQSKGLEFPVVVVGSLDSVPRKKSDVLLYTAESRYFKRAAYEPMADIRFFDFWRLYYVAFSRAQNLLVLARKRSSGGYFERISGKLPKVAEFKDGMSFDSMKQVKYKHVYSFTSHIGLYEGCPTQYKYYKEYGFAQNKMFHTSVGSLVHATLEDMNKCIINGYKDRVNEETIREWFALNYRSMQEQTGYYLTEEQRQNALSQVIRYFKYRQKELYRVWKAEEEINLVLPKYILQGVIDLVEGDEDTVEIVDYKTGPKPDIEKPERIAHYKKQLEVYAYLIEKRYGKKVNRMHLYYTSTVDGNPIISFTGNHDAVEETIREITETVSKIENKQFDNKAQNTYACEYCDMRYVCGK